jgi:hypothetical protein
MRACVECRRVHGGVRRQSYLVGDVGDAGGVNGDLV